MKKFTLIVISTMACLGAISSLPHSRAMAEIVILNDGSNGKPGQIHIKSQIQVGDAKQFSSTLGQLKSTIHSTINGVPFIEVTFDSPGGDVIEAMKIGHVIRENFLITKVMPGKKCISACILTLMSGVLRIPTEGAIVGIHRPFFNEDYFSALTSEASRIKYTSMLTQVRTFVMEMMGDDQVFRLMSAVPSDEVRLLSFDETVKIGLNDQDPAWQELSIAKFKSKYGASRWSLIKNCINHGRELAACEREAYRKMP